MKKYILLTGLVISSLITKAQVTVDPELGLNINSLKIVNSNNNIPTDAIIGLRAGLGIQFNIANDFYVKPGVYFAQKGGSRTEFGIKHSNLFNYVEIPVSIGYDYKINNGNAGSIFADFSPYLGLALSGKSKTENVPILGTIENDLKFGDASGEMKGVDVGFNIGLGYVTPWNIYIKAQYGLGLVNLSNVNNNSTTHKGFNIALGYKIAL